ncbi:glycine dehydrogenase subunit 1 [Deinobacterium chartae]|uniref:glycine dehydrogenase (aminomethyl-transferring) n=1 Tax=Deinobacterium chartae TaxID=521158 RepID=A0A841I2T5_9DEIO|nr:aminomethyl-transferring glycine dehydrogenase subunit GcvPA [Deinobacterium chartae]MBB6098658.1 glycine dehydrogenase subunit 1 [Deinobacterium chartae]
MRYTPHTESDLRRALEVIGVESTDALFADIPAELQSPEIDLPAGLDEVALVRHLRGLARKNVEGELNFLGGGMQTHYHPAVVDALTFQSEFVTAYTPYQPEVSQGELQATFEFQSAMVELTGLDVSNASMYDGASATAEAALLAMRQTGRNTLLVSRGVHPEYRQTLATYLEAVGGQLETLDLEESLTPTTVHVGTHVAGVIVQNPNFLGSLEDMQALSDAAHASGALFVAVVDPLSLAIIQTPGEYGADIAVGDGQLGGNHPNLGGPTYGFMVVKEQLIRQMPGRLCGVTTDVDGRRAFVLTLQAREQHIRRAKAKSNICSNHQLMALQSVIYLSALGPQGLQEMATGSAIQAGKLEALLRDRGFEVISRDFLNEFALRLPAAPELLRRKLAERGIHALVPVPAEYGLGHAALLCATELHSDADLETLANALEAVVQETNA